MDRRTRERKLEILGELGECTRAAARKAACDGNDHAFDALNLIVCAVDERIEYVENCD